MSSVCEHHCCDLFMEIKGGCYLYEEIKRRLRNRNEELLNKTLNEDICIATLMHLYNNEELLHLSAESGCIEGAKLLIKQHGIDVNLRDYDNETPLFKALRSKSAKMAKFLLNNGADVSITGKNGLNFLQTALIWSPIETIELSVQKLYVDYENQGGFEVADDTQKCQNIVKFLLNKKIDLSFSDSKFSVLSYFTLKFGDEETFQQVLQTDKYFEINALGPDGNPMLHYAICLKKPSHVNLLLGHGANIHVKGCDEHTSLHRAVKAKNLQLAHYLLQHGVDVNAATYSNHFTALHYAVALRSKEIVESLLNSGADLQAEFVNSRKDRSNSSVLNIVSGCTQIKALLSGIKYNRLHSKVEFDIKTMKYLLEKGAKTEVLDSRRANGRLTPLERACQAGRMDVLQLLAKYKANFHRVNDRGSTMIHHAVIGGNVEIIDLLLRMNLDINAKNKQGQPPLYHATDKNAEMGAVPLIEFLVDNGANVDFHLLRGYSSKLPDVVQCLLELSDDFKFKNSQGDWPLQWVLDHTVKITLSTELFIAFVAAAENYVGFVNIQPGIRVFVDRFYQECKLEVLRMKNVKLREDKLISLFDFLTNDLINVTNFAVIEKIIENLESSDLVREYPHYAFLLEKRIGRVKTILYFKNKIADFLAEYAMLNLPIEVVDYIYSYLRVGHIRNFARALSLTKKESKNGTLPLPGYLSAQCKKH